jgi:hypothetical protein
MARWLALLFALAVSPADDAAARNRPGFCIGGFRFVPNGVTDLRGSTFRDTVCAINLGARSTILDYRLVVRPSNGVFGSAGFSEGRHRTAYRPNPGYSGTDYFEFEVRYAVGPRQIERVTRVRVTISVI